MNKLIIALDSLSPDKAKTLILDILNKNTKYKDRILFKIHDIQSLIGFNGIAELLDGVDCKLMLDPKWHDIPNTLKNYISQLSSSGLVDKVEYITIHASG
jgi:orotidine-5'-phosphate decarboxylase